MLFYFLLFPEFGSHHHDRPPTKTPAVAQAYRFRQTIIARLDKMHLFLVNLGDVGDEVEDTAGVTPLVVVPADKLDKVVVEGDTSLGIEDGGVGVAVHVAGDNLVLSVSENACVRNG